MSASTEIRRTRCNDVLSAFCEKGGSVFFTLTTPDVVDIMEIRRRWRSLRHYLIRDVFGCNVKYVMNYEIHPNGHGWHIHAVFNKFIPLKRVMSKIKSYGFGRVDVRRVTTKGVADYLTKHALKAYRGISRAEREKGGASRLRLVNTSRGLPRLCDYRYVSEYLTGLRLLFRSVRDNNAISAYHRLPFSTLYQLVEISYLCGVRSYQKFWEWYNDYRLRRITQFDAIPDDLTLFDSLASCPAKCGSNVSTILTAKSSRVSEEILRNFDREGPYFGRARFKNSI